MREDRRRKEPLTLCTQICPDTARIRQHERLLLHLESSCVDGVAADLVYHRSCYKTFTNSGDLKMSEDSEQELGDAYTYTFNQLVD